MVRAQPFASTPEQLATTLAGTPELLLMLDYDGTLVPIAPTPDMARPDVTLLALLQKLCTSPNRVVAVISGRTLGELEKFLPIPGLYLAGSHGMEIKEPGGKVTGSLPDREIKETINQLEELAKICVGNNNGFILENKGFSLALHYRLADPALARTVLKEFISRAALFLRQNRLELLPGKKVLEIRPRGTGKGAAVRYLCKKYPRALPVYIGDDRTDEDGFAALKRGPGILVSPHPRLSAATCRLCSSDDVRSLLIYLSKQ